MSALESEASVTDMSTFLPGINRPSLSRKTLALIVIVSPLMVSSFDAMWVIPMHFGLKKPSMQESFYDSYNVSAVRLSL